MKLVVSVSDSVFDAAERLARQRQIPRSRLFAEALEEYVARHGTDAVTARLDTVYSEEAADLEAPLADAQLRVIDDEAW